MIRFDSLRLNLDTGPLPPFNPDGMRATATTDPKTGETRTAYTADREALAPYVGLDGILVTPDGIGLRLSAKIRGDGYSDGIHAGSLPDVCERINRTGFVSVTPADLRRSVVRRADPFLDVPTDGDGPTADALRLLSGTGGPALRHIGRGNGVTAYANLPNALGMLRLYTKLPDLLKAKNRAFRDANPDALDGFRNRLRVELQADSRRALRHVAGLPSAPGAVTLADLLDAPGTPLSDALDGVLGRWEARTRSPSPLPSMPHTLAAFLGGPAGSFRDDAFRTLAVLVLDLADGDLAAAEAVLRSKYGAKNWHRYRAHLLAAAELRAELRAARLRQSARPDGEPDRDAVPPSRTLRLVASRLRAQEAA